MKQYLVKPGQKVRLRDKDAKDTGGFKDKGKAAKLIEQLKHGLAQLQERLYAEGQRSVLIVLQGIDTGGKDGVIRHVMSGVNPQGCRISSFKAPTPIEKSHDFLWRAHAACPPRGYIGIFNRSYYEDILITRVHGFISEKEARHRNQQILDFEKMLASQGTCILKFFLHISKGEQKKRLLARMDNPEKRWKFDPSDLKERGYWDDYQRVFEDMLSTTSDGKAPWHVVPADHKWFRDLVVADRLVHALQAMDPKAPKVEGMDWKALRKELEA